MRRYLTNLLILTIPIAVVFLVLQLTVHHIPNSYQYKSDYIRVHGKDIKTLALGHSMLYDGFDPQAFDTASFNMCNSSQMYDISYKLIERYLPYMPNLHQVIIPICYFNVISSREPKHSPSVSTHEQKLRMMYYHEYMGLDFGNELPLAYRMEVFQFKNAIEKLKSYYIKHIDIKGCDSLGRRNTHNLKHRKNNWYNVWNPFKESTSSYHDLFFLDQEESLIKIIKLLSSHHIKTILVSPPYCVKYCSMINREQMEFLKSYAEQTALRYGCIYLNMHLDSTFTEDDFYDIGHLNEFGAEKFTKKMKRHLENKQQYNL